MITITVNGEEPAEEPAVSADTSGRQLQLRLALRGGVAAGVHVSRTQWDVFPWVAAVDAASPADVAGLRAGDCLLEAAGRPLLGARVAAVAAAVREGAAAAPDGVVAVAVWRPDKKHADGCGPESVCCGPMPLSLQRLSGAVSAIVSALECPVCLEAVSPPASQCVHGHLLCPRCRPAAHDRCPVCRVPMSRGRSLFADHVFRALADAFQVGPDPALADTIFGRSREPRKKKKKQAKESPPTNRLLARLLSKWNSVENLAPPPPSPLSQGDRLKSLSSSELPTAPAPLTPAGSQDSVLSEDEECRRRGGPAVPLFRCPSERTCPAQLEADALSAHARRDHGHVLLCMPDGTAALRLPPWPAELALLAHRAHSFYLKVEETEGALDVWLWVVGGEADAARYEVRASVSASRRRCGRRLSRTISGAELTAPVFTGRPLPLAVSADVADAPSLRLPVAGKACAGCLQLEVRDLLHEPEVTAA